ncbi:MAG: Crp/Fnr family transcriptional regulator [Bacteroidota bacterium]
MEELFNQVLTHFTPILKEEQFPIRRRLHTENKICDNLYLVVSGVIRAYYYIDGKDVTAHFASENDAITAPDSFIRRKRSRYNIEVLEDAKVLVVNYYELEKYLIENPHLERLARKFTESIYIELLDRIEGLVFFSAADKYRQLVKRNPTIVRRVSLGHIASYLGITQETLSRVRRQVV